MLKPVQRRAVRRARAIGHFAAMFVSSTLRSAMDHLIYGLVQDPAAMLNRIQTHSIEDLIGVFRILDRNDREPALNLSGTAASTKKVRVTDKAFAAMLAAPTRREALPSMIRGLVSDPIGMLERLREYGLDVALSRL